MPRYLPSLSTLISLEDLPVDLGLFQNVVNTVFDDIYYDHYHVVSSKFGDSKTYNLDIVLNKQLAFTIPGADISLILNPNDDLSVPQNTSFNVTLYYRLAILKFINSFQLTTFSFSQDDVVALLLKIFDAESARILETLSSHIKNSPDSTSNFIIYTEKELVQFFNDHYELTATPNEIIYTSTTTYLDIANALGSAGISVADVITDFDILTDYPGGNDTITDVFSKLNQEKDNGPLSIQELISELNSHYGLTATPNEIIYVSVPETTYEDIISALSASNITVFQLILDYIVPVNASFNEIETVLVDFLIEAKNTSYGQDFRDLFKLSVGASINNLSFAIEFPRSILIPIDTNPLSTGYGLPIADENIKSRIKFNIGSLVFGTDSGFHFENESSISFQKSEILGSGFTLEVTGMKLDLSRTTNIPEAIADGRPDDFIGVYIREGTIGFPAEWGHNPGGSTGELFVNNLLAGTGGISGTIGLRGKPDPMSPGNLYTNPLIQVQFGNGFKAELDSFDLTFQQNKIIGSNIKGAMEIPGFKDGTGAQAKIFIDIHIGQDGEFNVVASVTNTVTVIKIPDVFAFDVRSIFIGKKDGRFYIGCSGDIDFLLQDPIGKFLPDKLDINKLIIYDDGKFEIEGGSIYLPKAFELKLGPAKIAITAIHLGSFEKEDRKYKYFGFDGGVNVNPGGVDARGKGIKYYYTTDGPYGPGHEFKWFIRLESLAIDIIIPGSSEPEDAAVIIKGFLSIKDPKIAPGTLDPLLTILKNSTEYAGGVYVSIPKFKGLEASASMRLNPKVPAFIVDLGIEISTPILLGTTGLGIYGFRALFGKKYVASKTAAELDEGAEWWQYYKAKIDPDYKEGIQVSKFLIKEGFSFGAGVSLATSSDSGKTFSSKLFFLLSLPDVFLFQGQAQFLKDRIKLDANPDPPFFAIIAITKHSIEAGFGINYKIPDTTGQLVTVDGVTELGFFFGNSSAWYFNIGRESPDSYRIQARLFDILNMYFYFMISNSGIRAGAGVSFGLKKSFGPLSAELKAYLDTKGRISFRPKQIGGAIQMGGTVSLKCCGFGFSVSGGATLAAEAPKPHIVTGEFEVCVKVLKKQRCAHFQFTWNFESNLNDTRNPVLADVIEGNATSNDLDLNKIAKSNHMVTGETLNLAVTKLFDNFSSSPPPPVAIPHPNTWLLNAALDDYRVPVDTFIDIEFKKGLHVSGTGGNLEKLGGASSPSQYIDYVPPQKGKSDRVRHEYFFESIEIKYWDEINGAWEDYDFYNALLPLYPNTPGTVGAMIDTTTLANMKWGYWQQQRPGYNNKLRILAQTPLSYASKLGSLPVEDLGINSDGILCPGDEIPRTCVTFDQRQVYRTFAGGTLNTHQGILFKLTAEDGAILPLPYLGIPNALAIQPGNTLELFFDEPMKYVHFVINSGAPTVIAEFYEKVTVVDSSGVAILTGGMPTFTYNLIATKNYTATDWSAEIKFEDAAKNIDYIKFTSVTCYQKPDQPRKITCLRDDRLLAERLKLMQNFFNVLMSKGHFAAPLVELNPANSGTYTGVYMGTSLYPNPNFKANIINLTQGYISSNTLLWTITDNLGFSCSYSFELVKPISGFDWTKIIQVVNITPYTLGAVPGPNYYFLMTVRVAVGGAIQTVEILGKSCLPTVYCFDMCSTGLYRICYLSYADYLLNQTIPTGAEQQAENQQLMDSINKTLQPIWRPNTAYAIKIRTSDKLYREGGSSNLKNYYLDVVYGFRTAGPVGHYHNYPVNNNSIATVRQKDRKDFDVLENADRADDFKLTSLKFYIDYPKCYPNADGDIINAKPLFYIGAELRLFYLYNYVYEFYNDWVDYKHVSMSSTPLIAKSKLDVLIRDPEDSAIPEVNPSLSFKGNSLSHASAPGSPPSNINNINNDVSILNNMLLNGNPCEPTFTPLAPIDISTQKKADLKPLKLYTAQFIAKYNPIINTLFSSTDYQSVVHTYVFQTSRYKDFDEQVNSYVLKRNTLTSMIEKEAVFVIDAKKAGSPAQLDLTMAQKVITNNISAIPDALQQQYADQFDRLINGVLHIDYNELHAAVTTEFNIITHPDTGKVIGILVRNPEPFNDPKLPKADPNNSSTEPTETLEVSKWNGFGWDSPNDHYVIHSKDRSKMFITKRNFDFDIDPLSKLRFTFRYKLYNGTAYADVTVIDVEINLSTYTL